MAAVLFIIFTPTNEHKLPSTGNCFSGVAIVVGVEIGFGVGVGVGDDSTGLNTGFNSGFAAALTITPLFQTNLVPDFTQVNFLPAETEVAPALVHLAPALTAAFEGVATKETARITDRRINNFLRMK